MEMYDQLLQPNDLEKIYELQFDHTFENIYDIISLIINKTGFGCEIIERFK